jgi:hypothetical protein
MVFAAPTARLEHAFLAVEELGLGLAGNEAFVKGEGVRNADIKEKQHTLCTSSTGAAIGSGLVLA